jgi:hypothetical protein
MGSDMTCDAIQERLDEQVLARALAAPDAGAEALLAHAATCDACGAHLAFLRAMDAELGGAVVAPPPAAVVARAERGALRALRAREHPRGFARELVAALAIAVLALPLVVAQAVVVVEGAAWLLASWVPEPILAWLGFGYLGTFALAVGALYASIPLVVAWRRRALAEWSWR